MQHSRLSWLLALRNHPVLALGTRVAAAGISFIFGVVAARSLGIEQFGHFSIMLAFMNVGVVVALTGHESLAVREIANAIEKERRKPLHQSYRLKASRHVWIVGSSVVAIGYLLLTNPLTGGTIPTVWITLLLIVPIVARVRLTQAMLRGAHLASVSIIPDGIFRPSVAVILVLMLVNIFTTKNAALIIVFSVFFSAIISLAVANNVERRVLGRVLLPLEGEVAHKKHVSKVMFASSLLAVVDSHLALITVGNISGPAEAGLYSGAERFALAAAIVGQAMFTAVASRIASHYSSNDTHSLKKLLRKTTRAVGISTTILCCGIYTFSDNLLSLYGTDFSNAKDVLAVLLLSVCLNSVAGPTGQLLLMTKNERYHLTSLTVSLSAQIFLLVTLVPIYGALGGAVSLLASTVLWNLTMMYFIKKKLNVTPVLALA